MVTVQGSAVSTQIEALTESTYRSIGPITSAGISPPEILTIRHVYGTQACQSGTVHSTSIGSRDFTDD
ncbi:hypothetical protein [Nonomuraea sp. NPDC049695]|uniref:hypothetical protein n=1 Tax=Nonomuraea sp. NPDC049695 TaxID=3154734 RepID=UPI00341C3F40